MPRDAPLMPDPVSSDAGEADERLARLEAQLAEVRKALAQLADGRHPAEIRTWARAALAASAETPEEPTPDAA